MANSKTYASFILFTFLVFPHDVLTHNLPEGFQLVAAHPNAQLDYYTYYLPVAKSGLQIDSTDYHLYGFLPVPRPLGWPQVSHAPYPPYDAVLPMAKSDQQIDSAGHYHYASLPPAENPFPSPPPPPPPLPPPPPPPIGIPLIIMMNYEEGSGTLKERNYEDEIVTLKKIKYNDETQSLKKRNYEDETRIMKKRNYDDGAKTLKKITYENEILKKKNYEDETEKLKNKNYEDGIVTRYRKMTKPSKIITMKEFDEQTMN